MREIGTKYGHERLLLCHSYDESERHPKHLANSTSQTGTKLIYGKPQTPLLQGPRFRARPFSFPSHAFCSKLLCCGPSGVLGIEAEMCSQLVHILSFPLHSLANKSFPVKLVVLSPDWLRSCKNSCRSPKSLQILGEL